MCANLIHDTMKSFKLQYLWRKLFSSSSATFCEVCRRENVQHASLSALRFAACRWSVLADWIIRLKSNWFEAEANCFKQTWYHCRMKRNVWASLSSYWRDNRCSDVSRQFWNWTFISSKCCWLNLSSFAKLLSNSQVGRNEQDTFDNFHRFVLHRSHQRTDSWILEGSWRWNEGKIGEIRDERAVQLWRHNRRWPIYSQELHKESAICVMKS